jgi:hypothetical protein
LRNFVRVDELLALRDIVDNLYDVFTGHHIVTDQLQAHGFLPFHEHLFHQKHEDLLGGLFCGHKHSIYRGTASRRVDATNAQGSWMPPLAPHIDAFFHDFEFTVNFWIPFQSCGEDRPSLGVVRARFGDVVTFSGYDGGPAVNGPNDEWNSARFNKLIREMAYSEPRAVEYFHKVFADRKWTPSYRCGDAMMLSNWTLHFTHATPEMVAARSNVELRFWSKAALGEMLELHEVPGGVTP